MKTSKQILNYIDSLSNLDTIDWTETTEVIDEIIISVMKQARLDAINDCAQLIQVHTEKEGGYCDTGADMDWSCRSDCIDLAVDRLRDLYIEAKKDTLYK